MKILYDLSAIQPGSNDGLFHGGGEYAKTVFYRLCELLPSGASLEVFYNPNKVFEDSLLDFIKTGGFAIHVCCSNEDISKLLLETQYDVFYSALPYSYFNVSIPPETKFVYTIHGLRSLEYPLDKYKLKYKKRSIKEKIRHILFLINPDLMKNIIAKRDITRLNALFSITENQTIITVSNHSKYVIACFFPQLNITNIKVLYSPSKKYELISHKDSDILDSYSLETGKYILLIGGNRSEKGAYRACRVLYKLIKNNSRMPENIKVFVIGVSQFKAYQKITNNHHRFKFNGYVPTEDLEVLYKNAHLFLYPTLNEGFGYPPLEAMKYGTLCACSANSAVTEACGNAVLYFNPHDETEMSVRILQSFDTEIRAEKQKNILVHYKYISEKQKQDLDKLVQEIIS